MTGFTGEIVARRSDAVLVHVPPGGCDTSCGCSCREAKTISLPHVGGRKLRVSLRPGAQFVLLANTLVLPLCGFVAGAILAQWMFSNDALAFAGSIVGIGAGLLVCRQQSFDRVVIEEVSNE